MLHYQVKDFFAAVALSAYIDKEDNSIVVNLVRDHAIEAVQYLCNVSLHDWSEFDIHWNDTWIVKAPAFKHSVSL